MKLAFLLSALLFTSCCRSGEAVRKDNGLKILTQIQEINSWINLMPGTGNPSVHLTTKINLTNNEGYDLNEIKLDHIELLQDSVKIIFADIDIEGADPQQKFLKGQSQLFSIHAKKELTRKIELKDTSDVSFYFISGDKMHKFEIRNIITEKVY